MIGLKRKGCGDCIGGAFEFCQQGIAPELQHVARVFLYRRGETMKRVLDSLMSQVLILLNHLRRASHVGVQDDSKFARPTIP